jgi:cytolysin-activating lysine-acyltransferase
VLVVPVFGTRLFAFRMDNVDPARASAPAAGPRLRAQALLPTAIDGARAEGTYFRIEEPAGRPVARPFAVLPSRRMVGAAMLLMTRAPGYRELTTAEVEGRVLPAITANQARVFLYGLQPLGLVTWAYLSAEAEAQLLGGGLPRPDAWSTGDRVWIIDVVAPFGGGQAMLDKVRREALRGQTVHMLRPRAEGGFDTVTLPP